MQRTRIGNRFARRVFAWGVFVLVVAGYGGRAADSRLDQAVSVRLAPDTIDATMKELSQQSGVTINVAKEVGSQWIVVLARDRALREVLGEIASFGGGTPRYSWGVDPKNAKGYRFYENSTGRQKLLALLKSTQADLVTRTHHAIALSQKSDADLAKLKATDPRLVAEMTRLRPLYEVLNGLHPVAANSLLRGRQLELKFDDLTPMQQDSVKELVRPIGKTRSRRQPDGTLVVVESFNGAKDFSRCMTVVRQAGLPERPGISLTIWTSATGSVGCSNLLAPPVDPKDERPEWLNDALDATEPPRALRYGPSDTKSPILNTRVTILKQISRADTSGGRPTIRNVRLGDCLKQFSDQTELPVIADYDPGYFDYFDRREVKPFSEDLILTASEALDRICEIWGLQWQKSENWIRVRSPRAPFALSGIVDLSPPGVGPVWRPSFGASPEDPHRTLPEPRRN